MKIINRHGIPEEVRLDEISDRIRRMCSKIKSDVIEPIKVASKVCSSIRDGIKTSELDELTAQICMNLSLEHPDWATLGSYIMIDNHRKNVRLTFTEAVTLLYHHKDKSGNHSPLVSEQFYNIVSKHSKELESYIVHERDYIFDYFGFKTLERNYLLKKDGVILETPQYMWLRVSVGIWGSDLARVRNTYDLLSQKYFTHATPTLFNMATPRPQGISCFDEDTLVDTLRGPKKIKDVSIGDEVVTHKGTIKKVVQVHKNPLAQRKMYALGLHDRSDVYRFINVTGNHKIRVYSPEGPCWKEVQDIRVGDYLCVPYYNGADKTATDLVKNILSGYYSFMTSNNYNYTYVVSIKEISYSKECVYTLGVEDDHSYSIGGIIAQNCFLLGTDDSIEDIYQNLTDCALISKWAGGVGVHISNVRSKGSFIRKTGGNSDGILPMLKVYNETARYVNQAGRRLGSFAMYLEPWHADIFSFLDGRKNQGSDMERARDLFYALWIPDLFMKRVQENGVWSLMCPDECPGLPDVYGTEFEKLYQDYEHQKRYKKQIKARELWTAILITQIETGMPYMCYKDNVNRKSNHKNIGIVKSSNLCVAPETKILTKDGNQIIKDLEDKEVEIWNGKQWSNVTVKCTNQEPVKLIDVHISTGVIITCTDYHKFYIKGEMLPVDARDLKKGMKIKNYDLPIIDSDNKVTDRMYYIDYATITDIIDNGRKDKTYCFTENLEGKGIFNGVLLGQCSEIMEYSDKDTISCCNLASISLPAFLIEPKRPEGIIRVYGKSTCPSCRIAKSMLDERAWEYDYVDLSDDDERKEFYTSSGTKTVPQIFVDDVRIGGFEDFVSYFRPSFDYEALRHTVHTIVENLDHIIDINFYPVEKAKKSNMESRPIGIGVQGLADTFAKSFMAYTEAKEFNKKIFERIYFYAVEKSIALAKEKGAYPLFDGSPFSEGLFQHNLWNIERGTDAYEDPSPDWAQLREDVIVHGIRNSMLTALMPTASTSQILGNNESFEPFTSNMYKRTTLAGEFIVLNKYLMKMLHQMGIYDDHMKYTIMHFRGSIETISNIPSFVKKLFRTAWELKQKDLIDMNADRGSYIDQSQSFNIFTVDPDYDLLSKIHFYGWKSGLKTGSYYLRTKSAGNAQTFTMDPNIEKKIIEDNKSSGTECLMCSS